MQPLTSQHQAVQDPPLVNCNARILYAKQYWPTLIYKVAVGGAAAGQYVFNRLDVVAGFTGCGLIAMYALCYFFEKKDVIVTPGAIAEYQRHNELNNENLVEIQERLNLDEATADRNVVLMEEARGASAQNKDRAAANNAALTIIAKEEEEEQKSLEEITARGVRLENRINVLEEAERGDAVSLSSSNSQLKKTLHETQDFLENFGGY